MGLTTSEYDSLMREYEERRLYNEDVIRNRRLELEKKLPEYFELDQKISAASMDYFHSQLGKNKMSKEELHKTIAGFTKEKESLLEKAGYPSNYLDPIYDCKDCKDTGYVDGEKCHCLKRAIINAMYPHTNLSNKYNNVSFEEFSLDYYAKTDANEKTKMSSFDYAKNALEYCKDFVNNFNSTGGNILLYGKTGLGKTYLSTCIGLELLKKDYSVLYLTATQLLDVFERKMKDRSSSYRKDYDLLTDVDLLIIDDLGTEFQNSFNIPNVLDCINNRIMQNKSTVISTNLDLPDLQTYYTERFFSRICENYKLLHLTGKDIRIQKNL
ncbi:MAG: ATP-binding protein [Lachnospiraceae bacterium]|nr:ATP-binding protein [Lachnospiraceae bacterium]